MNIRKYKPILLLFMIAYVIIVSRYITYADDTSTIKDVEYDIVGPISGNTYKYKIDTSCIKYHVKANGYDKKIGDSCPNNFVVFDNKVTVADSKTDGYGQYTFKLTSLKGFIEYCYNKNSNKTLEASTIPNEKEEDACTYEKLVNLAMNTLSAKAKTFMTFFWNTIRGSSKNDNDVFDGYQDSYFFKENTYNAIEKIKSTLNKSIGDTNNLSYKNLRIGSNNEENTSTMEYLTLLTTYMYSINREEKLENIGRGDLVPFLYYAENAGSTDAKEIAKYAYVALIEEFLRVSGKNYWFNEYEQVFKDAYANIELDEDLETLEEWYDECYAKYKNDRGLKQNPLLGSDIETIIDSNYSISYQVDATEMYIRDFFSELGIEADFKENMARNELMARYMMENSYISDTIEDYCVEVSFIEENLQRGTFEEKNSCTAVLSDFQTVTFEYPINIAKGQDKDNDDLKNGEELGPEKWVDITEFFDKAYNDRKANGLTSLTYEEEIKKVTEGNGEYTNLNDKRVNGHVKYEGGRVLYRTYDYKSNPALKDTDFDGIDDKPDKKPLNGNFSGQTDIERGQKLSVGYTQDYRYFFIDNNKYNDELAQMSLIVSNLANDENRKVVLYQGGATVGMMNVGGSSVGTLNITQYMEKIGFTILNQLPIASGKGKCYIGYKVIDYYGKEKLVLSVFVGGFEDEASYKEYVCDLNDIEDRYESITKTITDKIVEIKQLSNIKKFFESEDTYCYWVTGKNIGAEVANKVASSLDNTDNIYSYTFACPNVLSDSTSGEYLKTIINEDDLLPKINDEDEGYHVDGAIYNKSIYWDLIPEYKNYIGNPNNYHGNYKATNFIKNILLEVKNTFKNYDKNDYIKDLYDEMGTFLYKMLSNYINETDSNFFLQTPINLDNINKFNDDLPLIREYKKEIADANSTKAYWCLVKSMDGYDLKGYYDGNYTKYQGTIEKPKSSEVIQVDGENDAEPFTDCYNMCIASTEDYINDDEKMNYQGKRVLNSSTINWCYKLTGNGDFKYSNYTIPSDVDYYDISYSQFWDKDIDKLKSVESKYSETSKKPHYFLYNNNAGSFDYDSNRDERKTKMLYGRYHSRYLTSIDPFTKERTDTIDIQSNEDKVIYQNGGVECHMRTLDGRIVAAMPLNLLLQTDEDVLEDLYNNQMHVSKNYESNGDFSNKSSDTKVIDNTAKANKKFKLVDVVMEAEDGYQYVIPFTVVDVKWLHDNEKHHARYVDNAYGQVVVKKDMGMLSYSYMNPIEPYLQIKKNSDIHYEGARPANFDSKVHNELYKILFGSEYTKDKIVSMRLYDMTFDKTDEDWWITNIRDKMEKMAVGDYKSYIKTEECIHNGIVVDY